MHPVDSSAATIPTLETLLLPRQEMTGWLTAYQNMLDELEDCNKAFPKESVLRSNADGILLEPTYSPIGAVEGEHKPNDVKAVDHLEGNMNEQRPQNGRLWLHGDLHQTPGDCFSGLNRIAAALRALS